MVKKFMALVLAMFMGCSLCAGCKGYTKNGDYYEQKTKDMLELKTWHFTSGVRNNAIVFKVQEEKIQYDCIVENGVLCSQKAVTTESGKEIWWDQRGITGNSEETPVDYIDIIARKEGYIVGYAVIKITGIEFVDYTAKILRAAWFPKIEGEYQNVTEEGVREIIEEIKNKNK